MAGPTLLHRALDEIQRARVLLSADDEHPIATVARELERFVEVEKRLARAALLDGAPAEGGVRITFDDWERIIRHIGRLEGAVTVLGECALSVVLERFPPA